MARDFVVRFYGDVGNLQAWSAAINGAAQQASTSMQRANTRILSSSASNVKGTLADFAANPLPGNYLTNQRTFVNALQNTYTHLGTMVNRFVTGYEMDIDRITNKSVGIKPTWGEAFSTELSRTTGDVQRHTAALANFAPVQNEINRLTLRAVQQQEVVHNQRVDTINQINAETKALTELKSKQFSTAGTRAVGTPGTPGYVPAVPPMSASIDQLQQRSRDLTTQFQRETALYEQRIAANASMQASRIGEMALPTTTPARAADLSIQLANLRGQQAQWQREYLPVSAGGNINSTVETYRQARIALAKQLREIRLLFDAEANPARAYIASLVSDAEQAKIAMGNIGTGLERSIASLERSTAARLRQPAGAVSPTGKKIGGQFTTVNVAKALADEEAALAAQIVPADFQRILMQSPSLSSNLRRAGLGGGAKVGTLDFAKNFELQGATINSVSHDITTGLTSVSGEFSQLDKSGRVVTGTLQKFNVQLDENGAVIGKWGGRLSGAGGFLRQTGRDFVKVIEWTVATTAVFGAFGLAIKSITGINELNAGMQRFAITAQLSGDQAKAAFKGLTAVAIDTATPLVEVVKAADDIALATRRAGQSTQEWLKDINSLTYAVGILTNVAGIDTVKATDLLTASFKQLGLLPDQLVGLLNKVTAAAGGQSNAVADIIQAVGSVSEAARAASMNVDEIIGSVQVLSQVTAKTPADVATAFKNLFGAINAPASEKKLKEFGIDIRDATGGLRPFLDIYKDIFNAINTGVIPQNRIQDVLRAIAGGPRRAPDAAALLGNFDKVLAVIEKSANSSNEALVANAKLLDTNNAKIVQLQNAFNAAIFEKFGDAVKGAINTIVTLLTTLAKAFDEVPTAFITTVIQAGFLFAAMKVGTTIAMGFARTLESVAWSLKDMAGSSVIATGALGRLNAASGAAPGQLPLWVPKTGLAALTRKQGMGIGVGGVVGGLVGGLSSGFDPLQTLGSAAAGIGFGLMTVPGPTQIAGAGLIAAGLIVPQLFGGNNQQKQEPITSNSDEVLTAIKNFNTAQKAVSDLTTKQDTLLSQYAEMQKASKGTADDVLQLNSVFSQYAQTTKDLADAQKQLAESQDVLDKSAPALATKYKIQTLRAKSGAYDTKQLNLLAENITSDLFKQVYPDFVPLNETLPATLDLSHVTPLPETAPLQFKGTAPITTGVNKGDTLTFSYDLEEVKKKSDKLKEYLNTSFSDWSLPTTTFQPSIESLDIIGKAVRDITAELGATDPKAQALNKWFASIEQHASAIAQADFFTKVTTIRLDTFQKLGSITQEQHDAGIANLKMVTELSGKLETTPQTIGSGPRRRINPDFSAVQNVLKSLLVPEDTKGLQTGVVLSKVPATKVIEVASALGLLNGAQAAGIKITDDLAASLLEYNGYLTDFKHKTLSAATAQQELIDTNSKLLHEGYNKNLETLSQQELDLWINQKTGAYKDKPKVGENIASQLAALKNLNVQLSTSPALKALNKDELRVLERYFKTIPGMANAGTLSMNDFITKIIETAKAMGLSGDQIKSLTSYILNVLIPAILSIPSDFNVTGHIKLVTNLPTAPGRPAGTGPLAGDERGGAGIVPPGTLPTTDYYKSFWDEVMRRFGSGNPLNFDTTGAGGGGGSTPNIGTIDIPKEILQSSDRDILIKQAITDALKLQHQIPGEDKKAKGDIVELLNGMKIQTTVRNQSEELVRKALDNVAAKIQAQLDAMTKADVVRRIRVGAGDFAALANVPVNSQSGISLGGPQGPITVQLNVNGQILTPAQLTQLAETVGAALGRKLAPGA